MKNLKNRGVAALAAYAALYAAALVLLAKFEQFDVSEPLLILVVVGGGFSLVAWLASRNAEPLVLAVGRPGEELIAITTMYLALVAVVTWGFPWVVSQFADPRSQELAKTATKLIAFVVIPLLVVSRVGGQRPARVLALGSLLHRGHLAAVVAMSAVAILFQIAFGQGASVVAESGWSATRVAVLTPAVFAWLTLEVGIVEEFFFRTLLQARLATLLRSETAGIVLASLFFGLIHAPGLYLRSSVTQEGVGTHPSLLMAIGYSIVITSVTGIFLGILWSRTRNLSVVILVHAAADLVPNLVPTVKSLLG